VLGLRPHPEEPAVCAARAGVSKGEACGPSFETRACARSSG
jgi:hypothetical protein